MAEKVGIYSMSRRAFALLAMAILGSCATNPSEGVQSALPVGFYALSLPQSDIPIGAKWRPGIGPDGNGAPPSNLLTATAPTALNSTQTRQAGIQLGLAKFLGLSGDAADSTSVELSNLQVVRVRSLESTELSSGEAILYEGLKAGSIKVNYKANAAGEIEAAVEAQGLPITGRTAGGDTKTLTLDGSDLFIAYKVVRLDAG